MNLIQELEKEQVAKLSAGKEIPDFQPGDTLIVNVKVVEGERTRIQAYEGVCIGRAGAGLNENFTVRKISYGEGVERVFPVYSPMIDSIKIVRRGKVRRAKLYYLRGRRGKAARIIERQDHPVAPRTPPRGKEIVMLVSDRDDREGRPVRPFSVVRAARRVVLARAAPATAAPLVLEIASAAAGVDQTTGAADHLRRVDGCVEAGVRGTHQRRMSAAKIEFRIDGQVAMKVVIRTRSWAASWRSPVGFTASEANDIARRLSTGSAKVEVEVVKD